MSHEPERKLGRFLQPLNSFWCVKLRLLLFIYVFLHNVNSQLVRLLPVGILHYVFIWSMVFTVYTESHKVQVLNTKPLLYLLPFLGETRVKCVTSIPFSWCDNWEKMCCLLHWVLYEISLNRAYTKKSFFTMCPFQEQVITYFIQEHKMESSSPLLWFGQKLRSLLVWSLGYCFSLEVLHLGGT